MQQIQAARKFRLTIRALQALHGSIEIKPPPLQNVASRSILCETRQRKQVVFHLTWALYISNIAEAEGLLGIKLVSRTTAPCQVCDAKRGCVFPHLIQCVLEEICQTGNLLFDFSRTKGCFTVEDKLAELLALAVPPVLYKLSFIGVHPRVDIYGNFLFELMNTLSLGVSRLFKQCLFNRFDHCERVSNTMWKKKVLLTFSIESKV